MNARFFTQYVKHIRTVGAVAPSSQFLANEMVAPIDFEIARLIVQFGPGTGSFTELLLKHRQESTILLLIEFNTVFYEELLSKYGHHKGVYIYNGTAEDVDGVLRQFGLPATVDYIVSGLPFASLPAEQSRAILARAQAIVKPTGAFITFQYTLLKKPFLASYFTSIQQKRVWRNVPPAYVLICTNR